MTSLQTVFVENAANLPPRRKGIRRVDATLHGHRVRYLCDQSESASPWLSYRYLKVSEIQFVILTKFRIKNSYKLNPAYLSLCGTYLRLRTILLMIVVSRCFISRCYHLFSLVVSLLTIVFIALFSHALEAFYFKVSIMLWCDVIQFIYILRPHAIQV